MSLRGPARDLKKELFWRGILSQHRQSGLAIRLFEGDRYAVGVGRTRSIAACRYSCCALAIIFCQISRCSIMAAT
jgi:hypothetical protein